MSSPVDFPVAYVSRRTPLSFPVLAKQTSGLLKLIIFTHVYLFYAELHKVYVEFYSSLLHLRMCATVVCTRVGGTV